MHKNFLQNLSETKIFAPFRTRVRFRCRRRAAGRMRILSKAARAVSGGRTEEIPDSRSPPTQRLATRLVALLPHFFFFFSFHSRAAAPVPPCVCVCVVVCEERERERQAGRQAAASASWPARRCAARKPNPHLRSPFAPSTPPILLAPRKMAPSPPARASCPSSYFPLLLWLDRPTDPEPRAPQTLTPGAGPCRPGAPPRPWRRCPSRRRRRAPRRGATTTAAAAASPRRATSASAPSPPAPPRPRRPPPRRGPPAPPPAPAPEEGSSSTGSAAPSPSTRPEPRRRRRRRSPRWRTTRTWPRRSWTTRRRAPRWTWAPAAPCPRRSWRRSCAASAPAGSWPPRASAAAGGTARAASGGPPTSSASASSPPLASPSSPRCSRAAPRSPACTSEWKGEVPRPNLIRNSAILDAICVCRSRIEEPISAPRCFSFSFFAMTREFARA